jgi:hypothetical protein
VFVEPLVTTASKSAEEKRGERRGIERAEESTMVLSVLCINTSKLIRKTPRLPGVDTKGALRRDIVGSGLLSQITDCCCCCSDLINSRASTPTLTYKL